MKFPDATEEAALHQRVLDGDSVVSVDLFQSFVDPIATALRHDLGVDDDDGYDSAIDAVFQYLDRPTAFKADRGRLATFLTQIAKRRAIDRHRSRTAESRREGEYGTVVELSISAPNEEMESAVEAERLWTLIEETVRDEKDRTAIGFIVQGERSTDVLAEVLGIADLPKDQRQREVKRHRDRLLKVLRRLGKKIDNE